jgi:hypothetical protein
VHAPPSTVNDNPVGTLVIVCVMAVCVKFAVTLLLEFMIT